MLVKIRDTSILLQYILLITNMYSQYGKQIYVNYNVIFNDFLRLKKNISKVFLVKIGTGNYVYAIYSDNIFLV